MRIFNSDGSEAEMCGNGIRCFARYVRDTRVSKRRTLAIETLAGLIHTEFKAGLVKVTMSTPILNAPDIPVALPSGPVLMHKVTVDDTEVAISAVSMGNPHAVIFAHELTDELVLRCGEKFQSHPLFPKKVNVEFVQVLSDREIRMRVYERGCGETMACGTGACAAVVAGILNKRHGNSVTVHLLGGDLFIEWSGSTSDPVYMSGPARKVFTGSVEMGKRSS
jgi:diaminopimelate epimerase